MLVLLYSSFLIFLALLSLLVFQKYMFFLNQIFFTFFVRKFICINEVIYLEVVNCQFNLIFFRLILLQFF